MFQGWDIRLANWIDSVRDEPFRWGPHDCITFANNAAIAMRGFGFADEFIEGYSTKKAQWSNTDAFWKKVATVT